jgi:hypothetical protein
MLMKRLGIRNNKLLTLRNRNPIKAWIIFWMPTKLSNSPTKITNWKISHFWLDWCNCYGYLANTTRSTSRRGDSLRIWLILGVPQKLRVSKNRSERSHLPYPKEWMVTKMSSTREKNELFVNRLQPTSLTTRNKSMQRRPKIMRNWVFPKSKLTLPIITNDGIYHYVFLCVIHYTVGNAHKLLTVLPPTS